MKYLFFSVLIIGLLAASCSDSPATINVPMPEMQETDSVELIWFKSPDSIRYFTYVATTDGELIDALVQDVSGPMQPGDSCLKEGKIYCFRNGKIFNTIYFGYAKPECRFLRYIVNGKLYYYPISDHLIERLERYRKIAKEPQARTKTQHPG